MCCAISIGSPGGSPSWTDDGRKQHLPTEYQDQGIEQQPEPGKLLGPERIDSPDSPISDRTQGTRTVRKIHTKVLQCLGRLKQRYLAVSMIPRHGILTVFYLRRYPLGIHDKRAPLIFSSGYYTPVWQ
jgi:hypothetical protein